MRVQPLTMFRFFLWWFGWQKVRMIGYLRPRLIALDDQNIVVRLSLNRRSRNHLHSMYFGAMAVGADVAGGLHGFYHAQKSKTKLSLLFKSFEAKFFKRPESDVYFIGHMGDAVAEMIQESQRTGERQNRIIQVRAVTDYPQNQEIVAEFHLELSLKVT